MGRSSPTFTSAPASLIYAATFTLLPCLSWLLLLADALFTCPFRNLLQGSVRFFLWVLEVSIANRLRRWSRWWIYCLWCWVGYIIVIHSIKIYILTFLTATICFKWIICLRLVLPFHKIIELKRKSFHWNSIGWSNFQYLDFATFMNWKQSRELKLLFKEHHHINTNCYDTMLGFEYSYQMITLRNLGFELPTYS